MLERSVTSIDDVDELALRVLSADFRRLLILEKCIVSGVGMLLQVVVGVYSLFFKTL